MTHGRGSEAPRLSVGALRRERGSLINSLVFILIATGVMGMMFAFFLQRSASDYAAVQQERVRSAISQVASSVLGQINEEFPTQWQYLSYDDLTEATAHLGENEALKAGAHLSYFSVNNTTGVVIAEVEGRATTPGAVRVVATLKYTPSGAGVFRGLDDNGRPLWIYSDDGLDTLALWEMAPNAIQYISPTGDYTAEAPAMAPEVALFATDDGARAAIGSVYCRYGGTAQYQIQSAVNSDDLGGWSTWSRSQADEYELNEGDRVQVQARARCESTLGISGASDPSATASYSRPITTVFAGPQVEIAESGLMTWGLVVCPASTDQEYRTQTRLNESTWSPWSSWSSATTLNSALPEGGLLEGQVQARCANEHVTGPASSTGYGSRIHPITAAPGAPTVSIAASGVASVASAVCPAGTTPQFRWRSVADGSAITSATWSGWSGVATTTVAFNEGANVSVQAQQRCNNAYATGPAGAISATATRQMPIVSVPSQPTVSLAANGTSFSWPQATCPAGTTPQYIWRYSANGGALVRQDTWSARPSSITVTVNHGGTLDVWLTGRCTVGAIVGPNSAERAWNFVREITVAPTVNVPTITATGGGSWSATGCPAGTTLQYQWRKATARSGSAWQAFSAWGAVTSVGSQIGYDDRVIFGVQARCINTTTDRQGPVAYGESAWYTRGIPAPSVPRVTSYSGSAYSGTFYWGAVSCHVSGAQAVYEYHHYRGTAPVVNKRGTTTGRSYTWSNIGYGGWIYFYLRAHCQGQYSTSGWSGQSEYRQPAN